MKKAAWYILFPQDAYALGPVRFEKPVNEQAVRQWAREWDGLTRLPVGFQCWPAGEEA
jgi:hypothetical protein